MKQSVYLPLSIVQNDLERFSTYDFKKDYAGLKVAQGRKYCTMIWKTFQCGENEKLRIVCIRIGRTYKALIIIIIII